MDRVRNPYAPGAGSPPPELAGRSGVIETMQTAMERAAQAKGVQHPLLVGLRGVGKTVLLVKAEQIANDRGYLVIDVEATETKSLPDLIVPGLRKALYSLSVMENAKEQARRALRVLKSFVGKVKLSVAGTVELSVEPEHGVADSGDIEADLPDMFVAIGEAAKAASRPVVIIIDELQYLSTTEFSALIMSIHKINQRQLPITLIGAGLPQLLALAGNSKSYAERLFTYPEVDALPDQDARQAITMPALEQGVQFAREAVDRIMELTHNYAYFLQQWSHDSWNRAQGPRIELADVDAATSDAIRQLDGSFFKVRYDRCTPSERHYMRALAQLGSGVQRSGDVAELMKVKQPSAAPTRNTLIKKGMIYSPAYGDTAFTVPMFDEFMRRIIPEFFPKKKHVE